GQNTPAVDLGQVALYHLILMRSKKIDAESSIGLLRFSPELEDLVLFPESFAEAQRRLTTLIGSIARVLPAESQLNGAGVEQSGAAGPVSDTAPASTGSAATNQSASYQELGQRLLRAYNEYGVGLELRGSPRVGPRFLRFEVRLTRGTRLSGVRNYTKEVQ